MTEKRNAPRALLEQMGGPTGLVYSALPVIVYVPTSSAFGLVPAIVAALGTATLILLWRLWRRESTQPALAGFIGVGICVLIAYIMGESKGYFLLGIWSSLFWATAFTLSVVLRRPLVGYIWGWIRDHDSHWRRVRKAVWAYDIATLIWVGVFLSRFVVQRYLYDADETGWLGFARIAMGFPLTALAGLSMYFPIRAAQRAVAEYDAQESAARDAAQHDDDRETAVDSGTVRDVGDPQPSADRRG